MGYFNKDYKKYIGDRFKAAEKGQKQAYYDLGLLYSTGHGVKQDYVTAHMWFNLAAINGVARAKVDRADLAQEMNEAQIAEAQRQAREWQVSHKSVH